MGTLVDYTLHSYFNSSGAWAHNNPDNYHHYVTEHPFSFVSLALYARSYLGFCFYFYHHAYLSNCAIDYTRSRRVC